MLVILFLVLAAALLAPVIHKLAPKITGIVLAAAPATAFIYALVFWVPAVQNDSEVFYRYTWFPSMGINLDFFVDGLSLLFFLLISGIGTLIVLYTAGYLKGHPKLGRFYSYLFLFMFAMLGLVTSDNIILMFVFWELTSISSFFLIGFNHEAKRSRYSAIQALIMTGGGGLALLAGLILLGMATDSYSFSEILASAGLAGHELYYGIMVLVLLGAFTKSAQVPFHFWLPNAMEAPTPVSAYLHSATMVKAGVFLLMRLSPVLGGTEAWTNTLLVFGGVTMLAGAVLALLHTDLKRILAYTTLSALGILVFLTGAGTKDAAIAAVTFLVVHSLYKGTLFMVAGTIDHSTGTRDLYAVRGLFRYFPVIAVAGILAALSASGIPPFLGFVGKELIYESGYRSDIWIIVLGVSFLTNTLLVISSFMAGVRPFTGKFIETPEHPHKPGILLTLGPVVLAGAGLIFGIFPFIIGDPLLGPAAGSITGDNLHPHLALWHGFSYILLLSAVTILAGYLLYRFHFYGKTFHKRWKVREEYTFDHFYSVALTKIDAVSAFITKTLQNGYLRWYIMLIVFTFFFISAFILLNADALSLDIEIENVAFYEILIAIVIVLAAMVASRSKSILGSIATLGIVGYGIALFFIFYGATDLALTQFSVETLTVILFVFIVYKLPRLTNFSTKRIKLRDKIIAVVFGGLMTFFILLVINVPLYSQLSGYFLENAYTGAHGKNVVNVILVDFRALDTLGEITVLSIAAIGVYTLLNLIIRKGAEK